MRVEAQRRSRPFFRRVSTARETNREKYLLKQFFRVAVQVRTSDTAHLIAEEKR